MRGYAAISNVIYVDFMLSVAWELWLTQAMDAHDDDLMHASERVEEKRPDTNAKLCK